MSPDLIAVELSRMCATPTAWSRIWHDYDLMTVAGVPDDEAYAIAMRTEQDRQSTHPQALDRAA
jgi:hypothetical protein